MPSSQQNRPEHTISIEPFLFCVSSRSGMECVSRASSSIRFLRLLWQTIREFDHRALSTTGVFFISFFTPCWNTKSRCRKICFAETHKKSSFNDQITTISLWRKFAFLSISMRLQQCSFHSSGPHWFRTHHMYDLCDVWRDNYSSR